MPDSGFTDLLIVVAVAFAAPLVLGLAPRLRLPAVVLEIVAGIVIGPSVLDWVQINEPVAILPPSGSPSLLLLTGLEIDAAHRDRDLDPAPQPHRMRRVAASLTAGCGAVVLVLGAAGCGDAGDTSTDAPTTATATQPATTTTATAPPEPSPKATSGLVGIAAADAALIDGYLAWTRLPEPPRAELRSLGGAHAGAKRICASPQREALAGGTQSFPYPGGTVIVKEASTTGRSRSSQSWRRRARTTPRPGGGGMRSTTARAPASHTQKWASRVGLRRLPHQREHPARDRLGVLVPPVTSEDDGRPRQDLTRTRPADRVSASGLRRVVGAIPLQDPPARVDVCTNRYRPAGTLVTSMCWPSRYAA